MELEKAAAVIRPRTHQEAIDLGFSLARDRVRVLYGQWLFLFVPWAVFLLATLPPTIAAGVLFWSKPLLDRLPLFVLSRSLFGATPRLETTLRALPKILFKGLFADLTYRRLSPARSFFLPITALEGLTGRSRRDRARLLIQNVQGQPGRLTMSMLAIEAGLALSFVTLFLLVFPESGLDFDAWIEGESPTLNFVDGLAYFAAVFILEPLYVAAGFTLYLNRRIHLEGWDIELSFRKLGARLSRMTSSSSMSAMGVLLGAGLALLGSSDTATAQEGERSAKDVATDILAHEDFETESTRTRFLIDWETGDRESPIDIPIASLLEPLLWIVVIGCALMLVLWIVKRVGAMEGPVLERKELPPDQAFGLDLRPESLPNDIDAAARAAWESGDVRGAISLLYRGALRYWIERGLAIKTSSTEGDCLREVRHLDDAQGENAAYFSTLTDAWRHCAYAHRTPHDEVTLNLLDKYAQHFGGVS